MDQILIFLITQILLVNTLFQPDITHSQFQKKILNMSPSIQSQIIETYDANSDGKISESEFEQIQDDMCYGFSSHIDNDNENISMLEKLKKLPPEIKNYIFQCCDLNNDGVIDPNEFQAGKHKIKEIRKNLTLLREYHFFMVNIKSLKPKDQNNLIKKLDSNNNNKIDIKEFIKFKSELDSMALNLFDKNKDGILDENEKKGLINMKNKFFFGKRGK
jgi:Ca2+-binding EF-hand superfamily protein